MAVNNKKIKGLSSIRDKGTAILARLRRWVSASWRDWVTGAACLAVRIASLCARWLLRFVMPAIPVIAIINLFRTPDIIFPQTANVAILTIINILPYMGIIVISTSVVSVLLWLVAPRKFGAGPAAPEQPRNNDEKETNASPIPVHDSSGSSKLSRKSTLGKKPSLARYVLSGIFFWIGAMASLILTAVISIGSMANTDFFVYGLWLCAMATVVDLVMRRWGPPWMRENIRGRGLRALIAAVFSLLILLVAGVLAGNLFLLLLAGIFVFILCLGLGPDRLWLGDKKRFPLRSGGFSFLAVLALFALIAVIGFIDLKIVHIPSCDKIASRPYMRPVFVSGKPYDLLLDSTGGYLYITTGVLHQIVRVDLGDPTKVLTLDTGVGTRPERMALNPNRGELYVENSDEKSLVHVFVVREEPFELVKKRIVADKIARTAVWIDVDVPKDLMIVTYESAGRAMLSIYSLSSMREIKNIILASGVKDPYAGVLDRSKSRIYVDACFAGRYLVAVDQDTMRYTGMAYIGPMNWGITVDENRDRVYVARPLNSLISELNTFGLKKIRDIPCGFGVRAMDIDQRRGLIYAGNFFDGSLDVIRRDDGQLVNRIMIGLASRSVLYDDRNDRLFVASECGVFEVNIGMILGDK